MISSSTPQPQKAGVKRKGDEIIHQKRAPGSSPLLQSATSPSKTSSISSASSSQLGGTSDWKSGSVGAGPEKKSRTNKGKTSHLDMEIESLLSQQSTKEQQSKKVQSTSSAVKALLTCAMRKTWLLVCVHVCLCRWAGKSLSYWTPAQPGNSPLSRSFVHAVEHRCRNSAIMGLRRSACDMETHPNPATNCTSGRSSSRL